VGTDLFHIAISYSLYLTARTAAARIGAKVSIGDGTIEEVTCLQKGGSHYCLSMIGVADITPYGVNY